MSTSKNKDEKIEAIKNLAYKYWEQSGYRHGHDLCNWARAEEFIEQSENQKTSLFEKRVTVVWLALSFLLPFFYFLAKAIFFNERSGFEILSFIIFEIFSMAGLCLFYFRRRRNNDQENKKANKLIDSPRHVIGALLAILGTVIVFCPSIPSMNHWYSNHCFNSLTQGMHYLSSFKESGSAPQRIVKPIKVEGDDKQYFLIQAFDKRQQEKTLKKNGINEQGIGYQEILNVLKAIDPDKMALNNNYKITNRRDGTIIYGTGQYVDTLNLIHVLDSNPQKIPILVTTEERLKLEVENYRNRWVNLAGTFLIILGIFWPYLWQGAVYLMEQKLT
ncbi:MAG: DUF2934 domain-containing protein [Candidatus Omnitrophota bacterium]